MTLPEYQVPPEIKYIGVFLTFACQLECPYCINRMGEFKSRPSLYWQEMLRGLSRFRTRDTLPLTLQGGEPTLFRGFYEMVEALPRSLPLDLLTNAQFDVDTFIAKVRPEWFGRVAPYAPIRVSYHRGMMSDVDTLYRVNKLQKAGFKVGIWAVNIPHNRGHNEVVKKMAEAFGIDFRWKEYLAPGHGTFRYPDAVDQPETRSCECRTSEILIDPAGHIFRCHADLYANRGPIGHILDNTLPEIGAWRPCHQLGACAYCDVKNKTNFLQQPNHCAVEIREPS